MLIVAGLIFYSVLVTIIVAVLKPKAGLELASVAALTIVCLGIVTLVVNKDKNAYLQQFADEDLLLKTVAHLDLSYRDDLELLIKDTKNDVAYYTYTKPERHVVVGDTVYLFDGVEASLTSVDAVGFTFTCDPPLIEGMSGTAIRNKDNQQIGCVSRRLSTGEYYAIWN